jgi:methyl-accepting chemotaxis protein
MKQRKTKLIRLDVQLRVVLIALCVTCFVLLINFQMSMAALGSVQHSFAKGANVAFTFEEMRNAIINRFLVSIALTIPISAAVGILYSFRFAGPLYRFGKYFDELKAGRWSSRCSLRKGDDLVDLCDGINDALDPMRGLLQESHGILKTVQALVAQAALRPSPDAQDEVKALMDQIAAANAVFDARLPQPGQHDSSVTEGGSPRHAEPLAAELAEKSLASQV